MIALAGVLEQINSKDGTSSPTPGSTGGHITVDFSRLSTQGQALLRGKGHWQERVELMHLHTTTHGTRRWSGAGASEKETVVSPNHGESELSPKGISENAFSTAPKTTRLATPSTLSSAAVAAINPFAAAAAHPVATSVVTSMPPPSLGSAVRPQTPHVPQQVLTHMHHGVNTPALRTVATHSKSAAGSAAVASSGSTTPRGKTSAASLNISIAAMNSSLASLSNSQRVNLNGTTSSTLSSKTFNSSTNLKIGNENLGNLR